MVDPSIAALSSRASALRRAGRTEEAIAAYTQLLALQPDLAESWYNLGWLQRQARRFEEALASYQQALDRSVSTPEEVHLNRAVILSDQLGRTADAASELAQALANNPVYVPALLNLGNLEEDMGQRDRARNCYERALGVDPANALALARLGNVVEPPDTADVIERTGTALRRADIDDQDRTDLGFSLGRLLDAAGDFDAAFSAYAAAKPDAQGQLLIAQETQQATGQQYARLLNALPAAPVAFTVFFASDSDSALTPDSINVLNRLKAALAGRAAPEITLVGHTDRLGSTDYNDALSLRRAHHVRGVLLQAGFSPTGMDVAGRGEREPLVQTADDVAEERNRRVEINLR